jgi:hypothetical protein
MGRIHAAEIEQRLVEILQAAREAISFAPCLRHALDKPQANFYRNKDDRPAEQKLNVFCSHCWRLPVSPPKLIEGLTSSASQ